VHDGAVITEQPAVYLYLADLYPEKKLAPRIGDPLRGPYLRWMVFYGSSFEPAVVDQTRKGEPVAPSTSPYGDFDTMLKTLDNQLAKGPWMLGDTFTAADILWGVTPAIKAYVDRVNALPSVVRANAKGAEYAAKQ
jgi:glutathione S-transferase